MPRLGERRVDDVAGMVKAALNSSEEDGEALRVLLLVMLLMLLLLPLLYGDDCFLKLRGEILCPFPCWSGYADDGLVPRRSALDSAWGDADDVPFLLWGELFLLRWAE